MWAPWTTIPLVCSGVSRDGSWGPKCCPFTCNKRCAVSRQLSHLECDSESSNVSNCLPCTHCKVGCSAHLERCKARRRLSVQAHRRTVVCIISGYPVLEIRRQLFVHGSRRESIRSSKEPCKFAGSSQQPSQPKHKQKKNHWRCVEIVVVDWV
jgi:hypothetical protein